MKRMPWWAWLAIGVVIGAAGVSVRGWRYEYKVVMQGNTMAVHVKRDRITGRIYESSVAMRQPWYEVGQDASSDASRR